MKELYTVPAIQDLRSSGFICF